MAGLPRPLTDRVEIERRARATMDTGAVRGIAEKARQEINRTAAGAFTALRYWIARSYAEGYVAGWREARETRGEVMPPPR